jgi:hypothetical protein
VRLARALPRGPSMRSAGSWRTHTARAIVARRLS